MQAVHKHVQPFPDNLMAQMDVFGTTVYFKLAIEQDLLHPAAVHTVSKGHQRVREGVEQKINHIYYAYVLSSYTPCAEVFIIFLVGARPSRRWVRDGLALLYTTLQTARP